MPRALAGARALAAIFRAAWSEASSDHVPRMAAALAYYSLTSMAPMAIFVLAVAGLAVGQGPADRFLEDQIRMVAGPAAANGFTDLLTAASRRPAAGTAATAISTLVFIFAASGMFNELRDSINAIWGYRPPTRGQIRRAIKQRFIALAMLFLVAVLLLTAIVLTTALSTLVADAASILPEIRRLIGAMDVVVLLLLSATLFAIAYRELPSRRPPWRAAWAGAAVTAVLFVAIDFPLTAILGRLATSSPVGAASSAIAILAWVYYSAQIVYFGAEFTKCLVRASSPAEPQPAATPLP